MAKLEIGTNDAILKPEAEKPWKGICCKACWFAKKARCSCRCKGANHQRGARASQLGKDEAEGNEVLAHLTEDDNKGKREL